MNPKLPPINPQVRFPIEKRIYCQRCKLRLADYDFAQTEYYRYLCYPCHEKYGV